MSELLLEIFSEEIPARMQGRAADDLKRLVVEGLKARGLEVGDALSFATPRRLTLAVENVPAKSPAISEERKGPRVGAPEKAVEGFLKAAGLKSVEEAEVVKDEKKGDYYVARIEKPGRAATEIVAETVPDVMGRFPWPKSMRWGSSSFLWVRPIHSILCLLGGKVVDFEVAGLRSGDATRGHRFHGRDAIHAKSFEDYGKKLMGAKVLLPPSERQAAIAEQAREIATKEKLEWIEDEALVAENAGLTEWPTVYMGSFDEAFLDVPPECLMTSMKQHQKCFSLRDPKTGKLANKFLLVSNLIPSDGGEAIVAGNEKVIAARLSDAKFFWEQDLKKPLDEMEAALDGITFHEQLGTQKERVERVAELAHEIAGAVDADPDDARRAAQLCKADLVSGMVGEFPELQGLMGRYYAEKAGTKPEIARAIELHYKPKGPSDTVPKEDEGDSVAIAVALADKLDTLVGFWAIGEKPTGSGDPYQLRRAALGVIRICIENDLRLSLTKKMEMAALLLEKQFGDRAMKARKTQAVSAALVDWSGKKIRSTTVDLIAFFADRLKVYLRDSGKRHDLIDAVFALPGQDDLALIVKRVEALDGFLKTDDGANLLTGVKRASNILSIEEKKDKTRYDGEVSGPLLAEPAERDLAAAIAKVKFDTKAAINVENFEGAMRALSELRGPVDTFFDTVTVNADDMKLRENRLKLLNEIRAATLTVADFSKIAG
ncbi:MAG: glycine--tRNA ligase subunit beta [Hyphomicrobiaceae bacterium]